MSENGEESREEERGWGGKLAEGRGVVGERQLGKLKNWRSQEWMERRGEMVRWLCTVCTVR